MAERSTAAVDVANESGQAPLAAGAGGATGDGATAQSKTQDAEQKTSEEAAPTTSIPEPPELHSGHRLARRYRLEECVTRVDGFSSWRAVDEKLRRAVGVHLLPADHPRARTVLSAARSAALLGDPRFVQVLDAVEENDLVYVVHEWLPDATELSPLLASGPLEPHEAYQLVSQVSQAMAAAHREGLSHLRLNPSSVLRSESGQYRIRGLAVAAALRGIESDRPKRTDTEAIGALLYSALTGRWPYPEDAHGLKGLPKDLGLVSPDQVRAGVHRGLSGLAMRALINDGAHPSRHEQPLTTPEELAKAVAALPRIRPPEPQAPTFPQNAYRQPPARPAQPGVTRHAPVAPPPPPALSGRAGKVFKWSVAALLIAALGLGSWQVADTLMNQGGQSGSNQQQPPQQQKGSTGGTQHGAPKPLAIAGAKEYAPDNVPQHPGQVNDTYGHNGSKYWISRTFNEGPVLAPFKQGVGIVYDLGSAQKVSGGTITFRYSGSYTALTLYSADSLTPSTQPSGMHQLASARTEGSTAQLSVKDPVPTRYVLVWITAMPNSPEDSSTYSGAGYKQAITNVSFTGLSS
ncbi:protein kinase family protein [Streptantibioticus ferralitis]|uniref:Protein kinase family protein n=1 Tax=Streptantibioticus ferralitis TaxID=236510 RepID=A0ABT5Z583_9ACTN|nr:protein kinase family protein [Streptantibioticus ferralitis]MDF2258985.1 protein kinase family protein [Streptantibioticus ferralitis]